MKYRSSHSNLSSRKQSTCTCKWCGESFISQRSDSKYCCDSHKTLASFNRLWGKGEARLQPEMHVYPISRKKVQSKQSPVPKTKPIQSNYDELTDEHYKKLMLEIQMSVQNLEAGFRKTQIRTLTQNLTDSISKLLQELKEIEAKKIIRRPHLSILDRRVSEIADTITGLPDFPYREDLINLIESELQPYLRSLHSEMYRFEGYRMPTEVPPVLLAGLSKMIGEINSAASVL
jgi:hypothetical protein